MSPFFVSGRCDLSEIAPQFGCFAAVLWVMGEGEMSLRDRLTELLEPVVHDLGLALWELEYLPRSNGALLRLYIDVIEGSDDAGITVEDCASVSHAVSDVLETGDPIPGHYTLEVSSPGLDRVLRTQAHFARFAGEPVRVEMRAAIAGRKRFSGRLTNVTEREIAIEMEGQTVTLPLAQIHKARLAPESA
ncbi:MAG: ribosome maturation factor RimP [Candidatus Obscuribacterales bacterium]|nr:ribosome maturation factor RimP [Steroidobacteraceae bacterium]